MTSPFTRLDDIRRERFDWGVIGWRLVPASGAAQMVVMDVELEPGQGHDFHRHPGQEEIIVVVAGRITQYVGAAHAELGPGDSAFVPEGEVHASFNEEAETARLQVVLSPSLGGETGYGLVDVAGEEPWASLRDRPAG
jgi:quercetin dioxygenase-like cupin family protein